MMQSVLDQVVPRSGGRNPNHMPPVATHAWEQARNAQETPVK